MGSLAAQGAVLVVMVLALPLTSIGTTTGTAWLSGLGLALIGIGALVPPVSRFTDHGRQDGDEG